MILFLNFAPITFMGGAEKVMLEYAHMVMKKENVYLLDVSSKIANVYGNLVLKRSFKSHIEDHKLGQINNHLSLNWKSFLPFSKDNKEVRNIFRNSRIIYTRFEFLEIALCLYFGGMSIFSKTIAGMHLTPLYQSPRGFVDLLHNLLYGSFIYKYFLKQVNKVHVITNRDQKLLKKQYGLKKNVTVLPIGIDFSNIKISKNRLNLNDLEIVFVGELSSRKGVDTLIDIISLSPPHFHYTVIGDGPLKEKVKALEKTNSINFAGYVHSNKLAEVYSQSDVLLFPSRAEAFGIVMAEAMAYGAKIVNSPEVSLSLPKHIEYTVEPRDPLQYIHTLSKIYEDKVNKNIDRSFVRQFAVNNYSMKQTNQRFLSEVINI